jgi:hypothetical protein
MHQENSVVCSCHDREDAANVQLSRSRERSLPSFRLLSVEWKHVGVNFSQNLWDILNN